MSDLPPLGNGAPAKPLFGVPKAPKAAPAKAAAKPKAARPKVNAAPSDLKKAAGSALAWITAGVDLISPLDAAVLEVRSERIAARLAEVAAKNDSLARLLLMAGTGSGWAGLATELAAVSVAIAANHGRVSPVAATLIMKEYPNVVADTRRTMQAEQDEIARRRSARQVSL